MDLCYFSHIRFELFNACSSCSIKWFCSRCFLPIGANPILFTSKTSSHDPHLIFYHVRSTSQMSISAAPLQRYLTDSFAGSVSDEIDPNLHGNRDSHSSKRTRRIYNGDSGENRTYHRRSQRNRLLHRSGIASKWSKGNLVKSQMYEI